MRTRLLSARVSACWIFVFRVLAALWIIGLPILSLPVAVLGQQRARTVTQNKKEQNGVQPLTNLSDGKRTGKSTDARPRNLPYRVEIGEGITDPAAELVLAIGRVTVLHCPEPPLQVLIGRPDGLALAESVEGSSSSDFYLRPAREGRTNLIIEMKSASVHVGLRIVEIEGGARAGDFHGEVFVRLPRYRDECAANKARVPLLERDLSECRERFESLQNDLVRSSQIAIQQAEDRAFTDGLSAFELAATNGTKKFKGEQIGPLAVKQITRAARAGSGTWWVIVEIENKDKKQPVFIQAITAENSRLYLSGAPVRALAAKEKLRVAIAIKPDARGGAQGQPPTQAGPPGLRITAQGAEGVLALKQ